MKVYTYSEARQRLADVLNIARSEEVVIKRRGGETFSIIAATGISYNLTVVTRNVSDMEQSGVKLFNPWLGE